jgi:putative PEP-CTERM system TPR-repeat lipoprotein
MIPLFCARRTALAVVIAGLVTGLSACTPKADPQALLAQAQAAMSQGQIAEAQIHLKSLLQAQPDSPMGRFEMGRLSLAMGAFGSAEEDLKRALDLKVDPALALQPYLESLLLQGDSAKIQAAAAALDKGPAAQRALAQVYLGRSLMQEGKAALARGHFERALQFEPNSVLAQVGMAALELSPSGDQEKAKSLTKALAQQAPKDPEVLALQAHIARIEGKVEQARTALVRAVSEKPFDPMLHASLIQTSIELKDYDTALKQIETARLYTPQSALLTYFDAQIAFRQGRIGLARERVLASLAAAPDFRAAVQLSGEVALLTQEFNVAEASAKKLLESDPKSVAATRTLGRAYLAMGSPERALTAIKPFIEAGSMDPVLLAVAAEAFLKTGDSARAMALLDQAVKQSGGDVSLKVSAANVKMAAGERSQALAILDSGLTEGDIAQAGLSVASSYASAKAYDKANAVLEAYIKARPKDPAGPHAQGMIALQRGNNAQAVEFWNRALALDPGFMPALNALVQSDLAQGQQANAQARLARLTEAQPRNVAALLAYARLLASLGASQADVIGLLDRAAAVPNAGTTALIAKAQYLMQVGQPEKAVGLLEPLLQTAAPDPGVQATLLDAWMQKGEPAKALALLEKQAQTNPASGALQLQIGQVRLALNDMTGAVGAFRRASELQPGALEPQAALANAQYRAGQKTEALAGIQQLQKRFPASPIPYLLEVDYAIAEGQQAQALALARKAHSAVPSPNTLLKLHLMLYGAGQEAEARSLIRQWWNASQDPQVLFAASQTMLGFKDYRETIGALNEVLKRLPNLTPALNNAAVAMQALKEPKAIVLAQKAYELEPGNSAVLDTYGWLLVEQGKIAQGVKLLEQAVSLAPKRNDIRLHYAQALQKAGDKGAASAQAKAILSNAPSQDIKAAAQSLL